MLGWLRRGAGWPPVAPTPPHTTTAEVLLRADQLRGRWRAVVMVSDQKRGGRPSLRKLRSTGRWSAAVSICRYR